MKVVVMMLLLMVAFPINVTPQKAAPKTAPQSDWKEFVSQDGNFAVTLPGTPADEREGPDLRYRLNIGPRAYGVVRSVTYEKAETAERTMSNLADAFMKVSNGRLIDKAPLHYKNYLGLSLKFETPDPPGMTEVRYILVNSQMYILIAFTREGNSQDSATKFLNSFRLLGAPTH